MKQLGKLGSTIDCKKARLKRPLSTWLKILKGQDTHVQVSRADEIPSITTHAHADIAKIGTSCTASVHKDYKPMKKAISEFVYNVKIWVRRKVQNLLSTNLNIQFYFYGNLEVLVIFTSLVE